MKTKLFGLISFLVLLPTISFANNIVENLSVVQKQKILNIVGALEEQGYNDATGTTDEQTRILKNLIRPIKTKANFKCTASVLVDSSWALPELRNQTGYGRNIDEAKDMLRESCSHIYPFSKTNCEEAEIKKCTSVTIF